jgi:hypothetical protein
LRIDLLHALVPMMTGVRLLAIVLVVMGWLLTSCVTVSVGPITAPPAIDASRVVTPGKGYGLIADSNGQVVTVDADTDLIRLVLDDGWAWTVEADPTFLRLQQHGPLQAQGFTAQLWLYKLLRNGETKISATGIPNCRSATAPCADPKRLYSVTLRTP